MRVAWFVLGLTLTSVVGAQPSTTAPADPNDVAFQACKARRHELTVAAMKLRLAERGPKLVQLPECRRRPDGTVEVFDPTAAPPPGPPFHPRLSVALLAGVAATIVSYPLASANSYAPFVELDGDWHLSRRFSLGAFASFIGFDDGSYLGEYDVRHRIYDVGARARLHIGAATVGLGVGVEVDTALAFADEPATTTPNVLLVIDASFPIIQLGCYELVVDASGSYSAASQSSAMDGSLYGDVLSARLAIGIRR